MDKVVIEKVTLTKKEATAFLGISQRVLMEWIMEGRLTAYRLSSKPKSPYLFLREDCLDALMKLKYEPVCPTDFKGKNYQSVDCTSPWYRAKVKKELDELLKPKPKRQKKTEAGEDKRSKE